MQVHLQLMLVCGGRQLQLFLAENRLECRSGPFQTQVTTRMPDGNSNAHRLPSASNRPKP